MRPGEVAQSLLLTAGIFLLLTAYYLLKTVREPLILSTGLAGLSGQELKAYAAAGQSVFFLFAVPAYSTLASRLDRMRLINTVVLASVASLGLLALLGKAHLPIGVLFYLWLGILGVLLVAQFWSFANDLYTKADGIRLFSLIATGGALGSIVGAALARWLMQPFGMYGLILLAALLLAADLILFNLVHHGATRGAVRAAAAGDNRPPFPEAAAPSSPPPRASGGFRLVLRTRYLLLMGAMLLLGNLVNTQGEFILADVVSAHAHARVPDDAHPELDGAARQNAIKAERQQLVGRFYGEFYAAVNMVAFLLQAFVVSRILKQLQLANAVLMLPVLALCGYALVAISPTLVLVAVAKMTENSTDYSVHNTVRQALFLPTSREIKYKAKAALDTFFVRFGDLAAGLAVYAGLHWLTLSRSGFAAVNTVLAAVWLVLAVLIGSEYRRFAPDDGDQEQHADRISGLPE